MAKAPKPPLRLGHIPGEPHFSYEHDIADVAAVQAWAEGRATEEQQIRSYRWVLEVACMTYDETFHPTSERLSILMQGRRFVGSRLRSLRSLNVPALREAKEKHERGD